MIKASTIPSLIWLCLASALAAPAMAQDPGKDEIICSLKPEACGTRFRSLRGLDVVPPKDNKPPAIDLYVNFEYNSAELKPEALASLRALGQALTSPALANAQIAIVGHTDAKGGAGYNLSLSSRRAQAVRNVLIGSHGVDPSRLRAEGRGFAELKDPSRPEDGINRRVEIKNISPDYSN